MLSLYRYVSYIVIPCVRLYVYLRSTQGKEDKKRIHERWGLSHHPQSHQKRIWLHGVSVGESISLLTLIHHLAERYPHAHILLTTSTYTAAQVVIPKLPHNATHAFMPLDIWPWVMRFLTHWNPNLAVFTESEVWPNMVNACKTQSIPIYLINGRLTEKSWSRWCWVRFFARPLFRSFTRIIAQSPLIAARFKDLLETDAQNDVTVMPNLKFAAAPLSYNDRELTQLRSHIQTRFTITAASVHEEEEDIMLKAFLAVRAHDPSVLLMIVPRHPKRFEPLASKLKALGLSFSRRSLGQYPHTADAVYLVDTLGDVGLIYAANPLVVLCGSFVPGIGGHNPIEPAQMGCCVIWGPWMDNAQDICARLKDHAIASNQANLVHDILALHADPSMMRKKGASIKDAAQAQKGCLKQLVHMCEPYLMSEHDTSPVLPTVMRR